MKLVLQISAAILLVGLIGWAVYDPTDFRHKTLGYSEQEKKAAWEKVDQTQAAFHESWQAEDRAATLRYVELKFGEAAAARYKLCVTVPPTVKANQIKCEKLMARIKHAQAAESKW